VPSCCSCLCAGGFAFRRAPLNQPPRRPPSDAHHHPVALYRPQFVSTIVAAWMALSALVAMFDFIELLRRSASKPDATFGIVSEIAALRIPFIMIQILPFAVLLAGLLCFWRLTRTSELIVRPRGRSFGLGILTVPDSVRSADRRDDDGRPEPAVVGDAVTGRGAGDSLHPNRRRTIGVERRPAVVAAVRSRTLPEGGRYHSRQQRRAAR